MEFKYQKAWETYVAACPNPEERDLYSFLRHLEGDALTTCVEDIVLKKVSHLNTMFPKPYDRLVSTENQFFDELMDAPHTLIKEVLSPALDELFFKTLNGALASANDKKLVVRRIYAITAKNKVGLSSNAIRNITEFRNNLDDTLRLELLMLLSKLEERQGDYYNFWQEIWGQMSKRPYVGAAVIEAFKTEPEHVWEALDMLLKYNNHEEYRPSAEHLPYFDSALETALYTCLKNPLLQHIVRFIEWRKKVSAPWLSSLVDEILGYPQFSRIKDKIRPLNITETTGYAIPYEAADRRAAEVQQHKGAKSEDLDTLLEIMNQFPN